MSDEELFARITLNPGVLAGKPVTRGTRLSVQHILNLLAHSATTAEIIEEYPGITNEDVQACLLYATANLDGSAALPLLANPA